jgi:hypothetical protein
MQDGDAAGHNVRAKAGLGFPFHTDAITGEEFSARRGQDIDGEVLILDKKIDVIGAVKGDRGLERYGDGFGGLLVAQGVRLLHAGDERRGFRPAGCTEQGHRSGSR